jgi:hypothetical protein
MKLLERIRSFPQTRKVRQARKGTQERLLITKKLGLSKTRNLLKQAAKQLWDSMVLLPRLDHLRVQAV